MYILLSFLLLVVISLASAQYFFPRTTNANDDMFASFIRNNPQILVETLEGYYKEQHAPAGKDAIAQYSAALYKNKALPVLGNAKGAKIIVEFFDYRCGYCRKANTVLLELLRENPDLQLILHPYPVLSDFSTYLSKVALAVYSLHGAEKFLAVHEKFISAKNQPLQTEKEVELALASLNVSGWQAEMAKPKYAQIINDTLELGKNLRVNGVPGFIIKDQIYPGLLDKSALVELLK